MKLHWLLIFLGLVCVLISSVQGKDVYCKAGQQLALLPTDIRNSGRAYYGCIRIFNLLYGISKR